MHVINGDSNMAEPTVLLKIISTDLVLRMLEDRFPVTSLELASVPQALRTISHDLTGTAAFETTDGQRYTALSVQRHYLDAARQYITQYGAHHLRVDYALDLWQRTLDAIETGDYSSIDTEIDWAIKKKLLDAYIARSNAAGTPTDYASARIQQLDLAYHDIDPHRGVYHALVRRGAITTLLPSDAARHAMQEPPATRARLRSQIVEAAKNALVFKDPFQTESSELTKVLEMLRHKNPPQSVPPLV